MSNNTKATTDEIFLYLEKMIGPQGKDIIDEFTHLRDAGCKDDALKLLLEYDEQLGGLGIYLKIGEKLPGIYRALSYVGFPLLMPNPENVTRFMIHSACIYLEELLKKIVRIMPWEEIKADSLPLGALVKRARKRLKPSIYEQLSWLAGNVYNFAKHHANLENEGEPDHYFSLAEAIAIYFIVRKLGLELEELVEDKSKLLQPL